MEIPQKEQEDAEVKHCSDSAERRWQLFLKKSFLTQDLGLEFLNLISMVRITLSEPMPFQILSSKSNSDIQKFNLSINQQCWQRVVFPTSLKLCGSPTFISLVVAEPLYHKKAILAILIQNAIMQSPQKSIPKF